MLGREKEAGTDMTTEKIKLGTRAKITPATALDTDRLLALAMERAPDPSVFETYSPFFWRVKASSDRLDFYHTRMRAGRNRTLGNFERGLKAGVSYQDSHNPYKNGWGQSLDGHTIKTDEVDPETGKPITEVWGDFYTLSGINLSGQNTDDFTAAIRAGVWRDVSVGFYASDIECGICGKQMMDWFSADGCQHVPGVEYEEEGQRRVAWAWINDGELAEVSQVYEGASPGAAVVKAEQMSMEGALDERARATVERRYQVRIATPDRTYALGGVPLIDREGTTMQRQKRQSEELEPQVLDGETQDDEELEPVVDTSAGETPTDETPEPVDEDTVIVDGTDEGAVDAELQDSEERAAPTDVLAGERARWAEHGIRLGTDPVKAVRALAQEIVRLRPLADDGKRYKDDLIADTIASGVAAYGKGFDEEQYRGILAKLDLDGILTMKRTFDARADEMLPTKRVTVEDADEEGVRPETTKTKRGGARKLDPARHRA